jgi:hypothetical protein
MLRTRRGRCMVLRREDFARDVLHLYLRDTEIQTFKHS